MLDWRWALLVIAWAFGACVNIFGTMPALMEWYCGADADPLVWCSGTDLPPPTTIKILYIIVVVVHALLLLINAFVWTKKERKGQMRGSPRSMFTAHHAFSIFAYAWGTAALCKWDSITGFGASPELDIADVASVRGYVLLKIALLLCAVGFIASTASVADLVRSAFTHHKYHPTL